MVFNMKKIFLFLFLGLFLMSFASAVTETMTTDSGWSTQSTTSSYGARITIKTTDTVITSVTKAASSAATTAEICVSGDYTSCPDGSALATATFSDNIATFSEEIKLDAGETYQIHIGKGGSSYTRTYKSPSSSYPISRTYLSFIARTGGATGEMTNLVSVEAEEYKEPESTGTVTLSSPINDTTISDVGYNFSVEMLSTNYYNISNLTYYVWEYDGTLHNQTTISFNETENEINYTLFIDNFELNNYLWNTKMCYANSTFENCTYAEENYTFNIVPFSIISEDYSETVLEGDTSHFETNISIITTERLSKVGFYYDNVSYTATYSEYEADKWKLSIDKEIPLVDSTEIKEFYWSVVLESGFTQNSTIHNQSIYQVAIDDCSTFTNEIFNFTMYDEDTQEFLVGATENTSLKLDMSLTSLSGNDEVIQFSKEFSKTNPARVCMEQPIGDSTLSLDAVIEYTAADKFTEFYNIQSYVFDSDTSSQNIKLYNLVEEDGQEFKITYKGQDFIPVTDLIVQIQRKYIESGEFKTIEIPMSGSNGYTIAHLVPNDVIYNLIFIKDETVLDTFTEVVASCQNPTITECEINLNALITGTNLFDLINSDDFISGLSYNKTTREVSSTYIIASGVTGEVTLNVSLFDNFGNNTACSDYLDASGGVLSCTVPSSFGDSTIYAAVYYENELMKDGYISLKESSKDQYGGVLIFSAVIMLLFMFGIGTSDNPAITGIFLIIGSLLLVGLNLVYSTSVIGTGGTILWFISAVIVIIVKGGNKR